MHLIVCTLGTALAMTGHFPHRPRLWVPHVVGLVVMLLVCSGVGGDVARWGGIALLLLLTACAVRSLTLVRERVEAGVDAAAMSVLVAVVPAMPAMPAMTSHPGAGGPAVALVVVTLGAWATVRVVARRRLSDDEDVVPAGLRQVNLTGSTAMLAGMTLMII